MFKDSAAIECADFELRTITMKGREVDEYINKFEDLMCEELTTSSFRDVGAQGDA